MLITFAELNFLPIYTESLKHPEHADVYWIRMTEPFEKKIPMKPSNFPLTQTNKHIILHAALRSPGTFKNKRESKKKKEEKTVNACHVIAGPAQPFPSWRSRKSGQARKRDDPGPTKFRPTPCRADPCGTHQRHLGESRSHRVDGAPAASRHKRFVLLLSVVVFAPRPIPPVGQVSARDAVRAFTLPQSTR